MEIISLYEVRDGDTTYTRTLGTGNLSLLVEGPSGSHELTGERAQRTWSLMLTLACVRAGLREDASIHEIREYLRIKRKVTPTETIDAPGPFPAETGNG